MPGVISPETGEDIHGAALRLLLADSRSPQTRRAYAADLRDLFRSAGVISAEEETGPEAVRWLCNQTTGALALTLNGYKARLVGRGLAESTVNRRLAAVRSLLRMARRLGVDVPDPAGLVTGEHVTPLRNTRGPVAADVLRLLAAPDRGTLRGLRDYALLRLMIENALRRAEVCALDVADLDVRGRRLTIRGKGKGTEKTWITISDKVAAAITAYLAARRGVSECRRVSECRTAAEYLTSNNLAAGEGGTRALFLNADRRSQKEPCRLSPDGLYYVLRRYGQRVLGQPLSPHKMRHAAITAALNATGGDVRRAQKLSRHADLRTLIVYDDNRADFQGQVTALLSDYFDERQIDEPERTGDDRQEQHGH